MSFYGTEVATKDFCHIVEFYVTSMKRSSAIGWISRYFLFLDGEITLQFRSDWSMTILPKSYSVYDKSRHLSRFVLERYKFLGEKGIPKATDYVIVYSFVCANCNDESSLLCSRWIIFFNNQGALFWFGCCH